MDVDQRKCLLIHAFLFPQFGCLNSLLAESKSCPISYAWLTLRFGVRRPAHLVPSLLTMHEPITQYNSPWHSMEAGPLRKWFRSWSCFLSSDLRFVKGRRRPCVGLETWIFRSNSGGLLVILAISGHVPSWAQISPWRSSWSSGLHRLRNVRWPRWRGGMEGGRMMKDGNQTDLRGIQTYPICDVSLLWVSLIIMRLHADCTVLHLWGSKRIKALEVFCGWPWREVLGCVTAAFSSSCSVLLDFATVRPCYCPMSVSATDFNFQQEPPSERFRKELVGWIAVKAKPRLNS